MHLCLLQEIPNMQYTCLLKLANEISFCFVWYVFQAFFDVYFEICYD